MNIKRALILFVLAAVLVGTVLASHAAYAANDDDGVWEVGTVGIDNYSGTGLPSLHCSWESASDFYDTLVSRGWTGRFHYGSSAWSTDWEDQAIDGNGQDHLYVDACDIAYFDGHGAEGETRWSYVPPGQSAADFWQLRFNECRWGNTDLEWVFLEACNTLPDYHSIWDWYSSMAGLHTLGTFETVVYDCRSFPHTHYDNGQHVADRLVYWYAGVNHMVKFAWFLGMDVHQFGGVRPGFLCETSWCQTEKIWGIYDGPCCNNPPHDNDWYYYNYVCS